MLDQMSGGRFELGVGRGVSPFETVAYALDFAQTQAMYHEAFQVLLKGLASDELTLEGKYYRFDKVPMVRAPPQRPHPPLWYGATIPANADWPAENNINIVSLGLRAQASASTFDRYLSVRDKLGKDRNASLYGVGRHVVVADTDAGGVDDRAARLSALAQQFSLAVSAPWRYARIDAALSPDVRRAGDRTTASPVHRRRYAISSRRK